tara:strand:- start:10619 stop:11857 length:1239 start_codon:yes stop_codon:yes gene_type:complete
MNIIEVEDKLKSVPDDSLSSEMTNPSGMFPQYLVMSEIQRRQEMRTDYEGRMAANAKTPPRPSMREEMAMQVAQAQPQPNAMQQGIGSLLQPKPQAQSSQPMMSNQPVMMSPGTQVPDFFNMFGFSRPEDDPLTEEDESLGGYTRPKSKAEEKLAELYAARLKLMPEKLDKERKLMGGLNLLKAGIAVGTSATPAQIGANLNSLVDSIGKTNQQLDKKETAMQKEEIDALAAQAGFDRERNKDLIEATKLDLQSKKDASSSDYMKALSDKRSPVAKIASDLMSGTYGDPEALDIYTVNAAGEKVPDPKKLFDLATTYQSSIGAREVGVVGSKEELLSKNINEVMADFKTIDLIESKAAKEGISTEQAYREYRALVEIEQRKVLGLPLETKASGGQINDSINQFDSILRTIDG